MGVVVSPSDIFLCCSFLFKGKTPHTPPYSNVGSLLWETVLHELSQVLGCSSSQSVSTWVPSMVNSPSGTSCSCMDPPRGPPSPANKSAPAWVALSTVPQVLTEPAPGWAFHRVTAFFGHLPSLLWAPPGIVSQSLHCCGSLWAARAQLLHQGLHHGLQGNLLWLWELLLPLLLHWAGCLQSSFSPTFSLLFPLLLHSSFYPLLKYVIPKVLLLLLVGLALVSSGSLQEPAGTASVGCGGSCWLHFRAGIPVAPATKTLPCNPYTTSSFQEGFFIAMVCVCMWVFHWM